jgi:benzoyl-CoA reductase/2-hydroxyglutaryl-CoA dehydratase subunit BcrC/BadD/HgdB
LGKKAKAIKCYEQGSAMAEAFYAPENYFVQEFIQLKENIENAPERDLMQTEIIKKEKLIESNNTSTSILLN